MSGAAGTSDGCGAVRETLRANAAPAKRTIRIPSIGRGCRVQVAACACDHDDAFPGVGPVDKPDDVNVVIGQRTSSRRVEDLHKAMVGSSSLRFGLAFCEASGPRLVRRTGNDPELVERVRYTEPASSPPAGVTNLDQYGDLWLKDPI
jgi:hypothetical protein